MEVRQFIRPDVAASAIAHLSVLGLVIFFTEVHPFASVTAEPIKVDIVTADQLKQAETKPDKPDKPETKPDLDLSRPTPFPSTDSLTKEDTKAAFEKPPAAPDAAKAGPTPPQKEQKETRQAALQPKPQPSPPQQPEPQQQAPQQSQQQPQPQQQQPQQPQQQPQQPQAAQQQTQTPPPAAQSASLGYVPPEPDVTVKYHVFLGLPPDLSAAPPPPSSSGDKPGDGIDATASEKANIASNAIAEFRRYLKTCSKLPAALTPSDNVHVKLRVMMRPDGKLAAEPILIEGTASMKGLELKQGAVQALMACQPYAMLPADRYGEWKVLDLSFTPNDFTS